MPSRAKADAGANDLLSLKAVLRVLGERDIHIVKSTIWSWRRKLPPSKRPPIGIQIIKDRPAVCANRKTLLEWVDRMEKKGLFVQARKNHATRLLRHVGKHERGLN